MDEIIELQNVINEAVWVYREKRNDVQTFLVNNPDSNIDGPLNEIVAAREIATKTVGRAVHQYLTAVEPKPTYRGSVVR